MSRNSLKPPSNTVIEGYVEKAFDEIFKNQIDKEKVIEKFLQKFKIDQRIRALLNNGKQLVILLLKS